MISPQRIKGLRTKLGLSQFRFAQILGTTELSISRWENGHVHPEGAAAVLLETLEKRAQQKSTDDLQKEISAALAGAAVIAGLALLLTILFKEK